MNIAGELTLSTAGLSNTCPQASPGFAPAGVGQPLTAPAGRERQLSAAEIPVERHAELKPRKCVPYARHVNRRVFFNRSNPVTASRVEVIVARLVIDRSCFCAVAQRGRSIATNS